MLNESGRRGKGVCDGWMLALGMEMDDKMATFMMFDPIAAAPYHAFIAVHHRLCCQAGMSVFIHRDSAWLHSPARAINALLDIPAAVVSGALAFVGECAAHRGPVLCVVHPMPTPCPLWMCVVCAV